MTARGSVFTSTAKFVIEDCENCGTLFALLEDLRDRRLEDHRNFYCPNGHRMAYSDKTDAQKQKERADVLERRLASRDEDLRVERMRREQADNRANGYKGAMTQAKKRAANGVCPVPGCKRSFQNVSKHVETCHPDFSPAVGATVLPEK